MSRRDDNTSGFIEDFGRWLGDAMVAGWGLPISILLLGFVIVIGIIVTRHVTAAGGGSQPGRSDPTRRP